VLRIVNKQLPKRWIGRKGDESKPATQAPMFWPPYSPDLTPCDFFVWGYVKDKVYAEGTPENLKDLRKKIRGALRDLPQKMIDKAIDSFNNRLEQCIEAEGGHIE